MDMLSSLFGRVSVVKKIYWSIIGLRGSRSGALLYCWMKAEAVGGVEDEGMASKRRSKKAKKKERDKKVRFSSLEPSNFVKFYYVLLGTGDKCF